ncbi:MFS transporter [Lacticaseibacillus pabuli]|uniref:MFS transporter n=1 Tax=Lacticaseibacillus pabuli TaxID=3025672 RepID=A0ABY7WT07_9LACO|nr:MFS transporter [Lacticaseibacillus sp. KACC 23028]WDF83310.1 MFS transporter [Lacticaseibacillus sp. KACC 23028]
MAKSKIFTRDSILILLGAFCYMSSSMLINPLIVGFSHSIGASAAFAGVVAATMNFTSLLFRPFAGQMTDRVSKYKLAFIGGGLLLLSALGYVIAQVPWQVMVFRVFNGLGFALCSIVMATWLSGLLPRDRVGTGMGYYGMMNALGMAIAPALGIFVYRHFGYRSAFICAALFSGLLIILIQFILNHGLPVKRAKQAGKGKFRIVQKKVIPIALIIMIISIPYFATQSYIVEYVAARHLHVAVGSFFIIYAIVLLILRLALKNYFDSVPFQYFLFAGLICNLVGMVGLTFLYNNWMMLVAAIGLAGGYGLMYSVCQATALLVAPMDEQGLANSTFYIGMDLGMVLGPVMGGLLYGSLPYSMFYPALMFTLPFAILVFVIYHRSMQVKARQD